MSKRYRPPDEDELGRTIPDPAAGFIPLPGGSAGDDSSHYYEPYAPLVGPVGDAKPQPKAKAKKGAAKTPRPLDAEIVKLNAFRKRRYDTFIDALFDCQGNKVEALAITYAVAESEIQERFSEYMDDVLLGIGTSSVSEELEKRGFGKSARVAMLARHAYNVDPKVSLTALKLATDLDGDKHDKGTSFEEYIRRIKSKS